MKLFIKLRPFYYESQKLYLIFVLLRNLNVILDNNKKLFAVWYNHNILSLKYIKAVNFLIIIKNSLE